jgi:hypothetical protein
MLSSELVHRALILQKQCHFEIFIHREGYFCLL